MRNYRTTRIALIATMAVYLYAIVTFVSLSASGVFYKEVPLISTSLQTSIPIPLTPAPTHTPTIAWTGRLNPVNRAMEDTFRLFGPGIFPFVFPFIGSYMLLLLMPGPYP